MLLIVVNMVVAATHGHGRQKACLPRVTLQQDILENSNLYDIAYEWTKHRDITNWQFTPTEQRPDTLQGVVAVDAQCVHVRYDVSVIVPVFLRPFLDVTRQSVSISKLLCIDSSNIIGEDVLVSRIPFIDNAQITIQHAYDHEYVMYSYTLSYPTFWYTKVISHLIETAFADSIADAVNAFVFKMC